MVHCPILSRAILIRISPSTGRKFHYILLKTVMGAPQSFYSNTPVGAILNRFSQDMTLIESQLAIGVLVTVSSEPSSSPPWKLLGLN